MNLVFGSRALWRGILALLLFSVTSQCLSWGRLLPGKNAEKRSRPDIGKQKPIAPATSSAFNSNDDDGSVQVQKALSQLRSINVSNKVVKIDKKAGIVGATAYYAKEAFVLLFMNGPKHNTLNTAEDPAPMELGKPLSAAVKLLQDVARLKDNPDAIFLLAELNFWGNYTHPRNYKQAFKRYQQLADLNGNATAQSMLGFFYATGLGNTVERDQAKAQLYHTFAAQQSNTRSEMTLAFRAQAGIGTRKDCDVATAYYKRVADKAVAFSRSGPPGGQVLPRDLYVLAEDVGGVYGDGASYYSQGHQAPYGRSRRRQAEGDDNMLEYLDLLSRTGNIDATFRLGLLYYDGDRQIKRNFHMANVFFTRVAREYWNEQDQVREARDQKEMKERTMKIHGKARLASKAAAYIGRLHLRGEGVRQNFDEALRWFKLGQQTGEAFCQYELGLMHLLGLGVPKNALLAAKYFTEAAQQDWPAAQARLGRLFLDQGDLYIAQRYFELAARRGHIEGLYYQAELYNMNFESRQRDCGVAQQYYKMVAEKAEPLHGGFGEANKLYEEGDVEGALVRYMMAAEQGYEAAQANVAWLLDQQKSFFDVRSLLPWSSASAESAAKLSSVMRNAALALIYWTRSARQLNVDSALKMGDAYFSGTGLPAPDVEKSVTCYQTAAEILGSSQAMWNLGWMYENGVGADQDFHLAKRYYDMSLVAAPEAYVPVKLALWKLRMRSRWNDWIGGGVNSMEYDDDETNEPSYKSWSEWLANFLEDEHLYDDGAEQDHWEGDGEEAYGREWDGEVDGLLPEDYYPEDVDDGVLENILIFGLVIALSWLVWYRQQRQQAGQQQQQQQQQQQPQVQELGQERHGQPPAPAQPNGVHADRPNPPQPNDPNLNIWGANGVVGQ